MNIPVFGVTQAHLFLPGEEASGKATGTVSVSVTTFSVLETHCFLRIEVRVELRRLIFPVEALLCDESDDASDEHDASSDKFDLSSAFWSFCLKIEGTETQFKCGGEGTTNDGAFLPLVSPISCVFSTLLLGFETGLRTSVDLSLFPAGPRTGRDSDSAQFIDLTRGGPDIEITV